jgi:outer membrane lipoprotein carrier protein
MATRRRMPRMLGGLLVALAYGAGATGEAADAEQLLARLQRWLDGTHRLSARFEQVLLSGALGAGLEESGRVYIERPGRMRWDYLEPEVKVALVDGDRTRLYLAEDRQLVESTLSEADSLLPQLLAGDRPLAEIFEVAAVPGDPRGGGPLRLRLTPRREAASLEEVVLILHDPARVELREVEVLDATGNRLLYRFTALERNRGLPRDAFTFVPPPGTEIVADRPGGG